MKHIQSTGWAVRTWKQSLTGHPFYCQALNGARFLTTVCMALHLLSKKLFSPRCLDTRELLGISGKVKDGFRIAPGSTVTEETVSASRRWRNTRGIRCSPTRGLGALALVGKDSISF